MTTPTTCCCRGWSRTRWPGSATDHRAVLLACYYRGMSVADAARLLEVPEGTVKSRTHYALRALRLALEEMGVTA